MKKITHLFLTLIAINIVTPVLAEAKDLSVEERFQACIVSPDCQPEEQLQLVAALSAEMSLAAQKMVKICSSKVYLNCMGPKHEETRQWYKMNQHAREVLRLAEHSQAADPVDEPKIKNNEEDLYQRVENQR